LNNVELPEGQHILRLNFKGGELNFGRMTFTYQEALGYQPPIADAGIDGSVLKPETTVSLDGSASENPSGGTLTYAWEQIAGPALANISDSSAIAPLASEMTIDGIYRFQLTVNDGAHEDFDVIEFLRGDLEARPPTASILSPSPDSLGIAGQPLGVVVSANDPDGEVAKVDLFNGDLHIGTLTESPYTFTWYPPEGIHELSVIVTDSDNLTATSSVVTFTANPALPCTRASESGDFEYEFSPGGENTTVTFIPSRPGVGSNIIIFYYGVGGGPYPGYILTPNTPFPLNAAEGETIGFYFTYSVPEGGERNTIAENTTYTIGTCAEATESDPDIALINWQMAHFDPADLANSELEATLWGDFADPEADGIINLLEFTSGTDPLLESAFPVEAVLDKLSGQWRIRYTRRLGLPATYGQLEWSTDLLTWGSEGVSSFAISLKDGIELIEARIGFLDAGPDAPVFVRLTTTP
jgi:hypothetical protein